MTEGAKAFITPLTLQALSGRAVRDHVFDSDAELAMGHIELARWADLIIIAPASANVIASLSQGQAGSLISTLCLATSAPVVICPAMNEKMWAHPATKKNVRRLKSFGYDIFGPAKGEQACGDMGWGRMQEPEMIVEHARTYFSDGDLTGLTVLITAGPTREAIDPVRFISNHSSGKMGYAMAIAARARGARVILISGPTALERPDNVDFIQKLSNRKNLHTCCTKDYKLFGNRENIETIKEKLGKLGLEIEESEHLLKTYGSNAVVVADFIKRYGDRKIHKNYPTLEAELYYCVEHEFVKNPLDFLVRRVGLGLIDTDATKESLKRVASILKELLGWSDEMCECKVKEASKLLNEGI